MKMRMQLKSLTLLLGCAIVFVLLLYVEYPYYSYGGQESSLRRSVGIHAPDKPEDSYTMPCLKDTRNFSRLGKWLRAPEGTKPPSPNHTPPPGQRYKILMWKHGVHLSQRHIRNYSTNSSGTFSPWLGCSVDDCDISYRDEDLAIADAVIFHLHMTKNREEIPAAKGKAGQIWIFLTDEAPFVNHIFMYYNGNNGFSRYDNTFDWSMTYREESDVPVAYGRTIAKRRDPITDKADEEVWQQRRKLKTEMVVILGSHCHSRNNERWKYAEKLEALLGDRMHVYGKCLDGNQTACPGHFRRDCPILVNYKFYLAFENSNCREYMTEKVFWNAYGKGSVPVIMGAPRTDCKRLLPPQSYIHIDDFASPDALAKYLRYLDKHDEEYDKYHAWRSSYKVLNEHGYFGSRSVHYCRVCEALHYNDRPPLIPKIRQLSDFLNSDRDCYPYKL